jgi:hypothetical protein
MCDDEIGDYIIKLRSGREVCSTNRILGISPTLDITQGLDEHITMMPDEMWDEPDWGGLAPDEIADILGPGQAQLTIRNLSTIQTTEIPAIRKLLQASFLSLIQESWKVRPAAPLSVPPAA